MSSSNFSTSGQLPVPLIIPDTQAAMPTTSGSSFNIFRMIINDGQRTKLKQPIVDLESEDLSETREAVTKSPVAKRRKEDSKTDEVSSMASTDRPDHIAKSSQGRLCNAKKSEVKSVLGASVVDLTSEDANELSLITSSQVGDVIDITSESVSPCSTIVEISDYEDDVVCLNDLTVLDEEVSILEDDVVNRETSNSFKKKYGNQIIGTVFFKRQSPCAPSRSGYATYYKPQTDMTGEGCAVFVRNSKLEVVSYRTVEYFIGSATSMNRDQIGQILRIRCRETDQEFIFANTHLLFNSARGDIKLGQLAMLIANIEDELTKSRCPVVLCGDLNIEPLSYVYTYISESSVYLRGLRRNELSGQGRYGGPYVVADNILPPVANIGRDSMFINKEVHRQAVVADYFTHPLRLTSVYHHFSVNGEKEISTYHKDMANPDFLFYSIEKKVTADSRTHIYEVPELRLLRRLSLPDFTILRKTCGPWPNRYVPSDHIPLVADFVLSKIDRDLIPTSHEARRGAPGGGQGNNRDNRGPKETLRLVETQVDSGDVHNFLLRRFGISLCF
ncbi:unnamed protein product [Angiostrongylus costaricensis]|uniref:Endo/exonuclease/phosphatase domain-containing protein n=1 Tax=Angiostrongylus costaricensis TaxID=334426 RepID=A0A158PM30_ANGCS|nr:unnamed protein product [Angiostrongylus costaricensis]